MGGLGEGWFCKIGNIGWLEFVRSLYIVKVMFFYFEWILFEFGKMLWYYFKLFLVFVILLKYYGFFFEILGMYVFVFMMSFV